MWRRTFIEPLALVVLLALLTGCPGPSAGLDPDLEPLRLVVDPQVTPATPTVEGLEEGDPPLPVGAILSAEGVQTDFVLGEFIVEAIDRAALAPLLARWGGVIVDELAPDADSEPGDLPSFLVRIDPNRADTSAMLEDFSALGPNAGGEYRLSSQAAQQLLAIVAHEAARHGAVLSLNLVYEPDGIVDGFTAEAPGSDAFAWSYMRLGGSQDIGVGAAWQLLEEAGRLHPWVPLMIIDGGFVPNDDFPTARRIRRANWGDGHRFGLHGTLVTVTAMGQVDNGFGAAGPAGPVARLIAMHAPSTSWKGWKEIRQVTGEERPLIVNMSYSRSVTDIVQLEALRYANKHLRPVRSRGALLFASASNGDRNIDRHANRCPGCPERELVLPCESDAVICVGGFTLDSTKRHTRQDSIDVLDNAACGGSNFGTKTGQESVEIYGPYVTWSALEDDPTANVLGRFCGTSSASPFVAGVAALVWAADPTLTREQVWLIMRETAHQGLADSPDVTGETRRINAFGAVTRALGYDAWSAPTITIDAPTSAPLGHEVWFEADARDHRGRVVPAVRWHIAGAERETRPAGARHVTFTDVLPVGTHTITATARDVVGFEATASATIVIDYQPLEVTITAPHAGSTTWANEPLNLHGGGWSGEVPLDDHQLSWRVISIGAGSTTVHSATGRTTTVPANRLPPGRYRIELTGSDGVETASRTITRDLAQKPAWFPTATIISPEHGDRHPIPVTAAAATIDFAGSASDPEDGVLDGTSLRWTALIVSADGLVEWESVLCEGSTFRGVAHPPRDCGAFSAQLGVMNAGPTNQATDYTIRLEAKDSDGHTHGPEVGIKVVIPPAP
jgi:serine protease